MAETFRAHDGVAAFRARARGLSQSCISQDTETGAPPVYAPFLGMWLARKLQVKSKVRRLVFSPIAQENWVDKLVAHVTSFSYVRDGYHSPAPCIVLLRSRRLFRRWRWETDVEALRGISQHSS